MIKLQERDLSILLYLKKVGWSLPTYISFHFFNSNQRAASNRLLKLEKLNLITSSTLKDLSSILIEQDTIKTLFFCLSLKTKIYRLHESVVNVVGEDLEYNTDKRLLMHQLMASYVLKRLSSQFALSSYTTEEEHKKFHKINDFYSSFNETEPDLIVNIKGKTVAIEIERKARRGLGVFNNAYNNRIDKLISEFDFVIYVMENTKDLTKLISISEGLKRVGFLSIFDLNSVLRRGYEKTSLSEFLEVN